ncbi:MAG: helix-turn-helix transcriptional regulator [Paenibacillaceae bacterium]|nr:helix-turn-helix transcriptional regulator [Paenibacillaceae bacterium]
MAQRDAAGSYLAHMQIDITTAQYYYCTSNWRHPNFISDYNRLYYFLGEGAYLRIGDRELYPAAGHLVVLPAATKLTVLALDDRTFYKYYCHFTATVGEMNLFKLLTMNDAVMAHDLDAVAARFAELTQHANGSGITSALRAKLALQELLCYFIEHNDTVRLNWKASAAMEKTKLVLAYLDEHLADDIRLDDLAKLLHFHPGYFIPYFKSLFGLTPMQYVKRKRMETAKQLLIESGLSVSEIAERVGSSLYPFSKSFKSYTGYSPSDYRSHAGIR